MFSGRSGESPPSYNAVPGAPGTCDYDGHFISDRVASGARPLGPELVLIGHHLSPLLRVLLAVGNPEMVIRVIFFKIITVIIIQYLSKFSSFSIFRAGISEHVLGSNSDIDNSSGIQIYLMTIRFLIFEK